MVELYVGGKKAGIAADSDRIIRDAAANFAHVEYRLPDGRVLGTFTPVPFDEPPCPWDPSITSEEIERRLAGEMLTFDELKQRLGWE